MVDPEPFDDPGPLDPQPPGRARRVATVAILVLLIVSMVFLAFVSGRGLVTVAPVGPDQPAPSLPSAAGSAAPTDGRLAKLAVVDTAGRLTTTDASGSAVPLGAAGVTYSSPTWSPSGDRIAVIGQDGATGLMQVFPVPPTTATDDPRPLYSSPDEPPFYAYWSPDGRQLSFLTTESDGIALRVAPADGSAPATIVRRGTPLYWVWTDDARMLLHVGGAGPDAFVGQVGSDGVSVEPTALIAGGFRVPAVTSDGVFRAYVAPGEQTTDQVVVESPTGTGRQAVGVHGAAAIGFSPTGSELAFIAPDAPGREVGLPLGPLRLMTASTGEVRVILTGPVVAFFWSPDGRTIAALQVVGPGDDNVALTDRGGIVRLARARIAAADPGVTVGLVFVDPATGAVASQRPIQLADVFVAQVLPYFDQYALSHRLWSPDSRSIALPIVAPDGTTGIVVIPADGTETTRVADGVSAAWSP